MEAQNGGTGEDDKLWSDEFTCGCTLVAGYTEEEKYSVNNVLSKVVSRLRASNSVRKTFHIRNSRVPIIKVTENRPRCMRRIWDAVWALSTCTVAACPMCTLPICGSHMLIFPVLQCTTVEGVDVDVSVNGDRGIRAAQFLIEEQARRPALRPLTLLTKAILKVKRTNSPTALQGLV